LPEKLPIYFPHDRFPYAQTMDSTPFIQLTPLRIGLRQNWRHAVGREAQNERVQLSLRRGVHIRLMESVYLNDGQSFYIRQGFA